MCSPRPNLDEVLDEFVVPTVCRVKYNPILNRFLYTFPDDGVFPQHAVCCDFPCFSSPISLWFFFFLQRWLVFWWPCLPFVCTVRSTTLCAPFYELPISCLPSLSMSTLVRGFLEWLSTYSVDTEMMVGVFLCDSLFPGLCDSRCSKYDSVPKHGSQSPVPDYASFCASFSWRTRP